MQTLQDLFVTSRSRGPHVSELWKVAHLGLRRLSTLPGDLVSGVSGTPKVGRPSWGQRKSREAKILGVHMKQFCYNILR